jgi:hypothetical protein
MKFCPVVPEICRGQVHGPRKERRMRRKRRIIIITRYDYNLTIKRTKFHETLWSYRYMFLVGPKVFSFVVKGVKVIF